MKNETGSYNKRIQIYKKKINPRIAKDISDIIQPYCEIISNSSDYYKLRTIGISIGKINIKVKEDVERLLDAFKEAAYVKINEKIKHISSADKTKNFNIKNLKRFLKEQNIDLVYYPILHNSIYGKMVINLALEDFKLITHNTKKAIFFSFEIVNLDALDNLIKPKLHEMSNAVLIVTGNEETTLDELDLVWSSVLKYLSKNTKTAFAYKIDDVDKLQVNLLAVK